MKKLFYILSLLLITSLNTFSITGVSTGYIDNIVTKTINISGDVRSGWPNKEITNVVFDCTIDSGTSVTIGNIVLPSANIRKILVELLNTNLVPYSQYLTINSFSSSQPDGLSLVNCSYINIMSVNLTNNYPVGISNVSLLTTPYSLNNNALIRMYSSSVNELNRISSTNLVVLSIITNSTSMVITNPDYSSVWTGQTVSVTITTNSVYSSTNNVTISTNLNNATLISSNVFSTVLGFAVTNGGFDYSVLYTNQTSIPSGFVSAFGNYTTNLYAAISNNIYQTSDGKNWQPSITGLVNSASTLCSYYGELYAGAGNSVYVFDGISWNVSANCPDGIVLSSISYSNNLYVGGNGFIYKFDNVDWSISTNVMTNSIDCFGVLNETLYAGDNLGNILVYDGSSWSQFTNLTYSITSLYNYQTNLYASSGNTATGKGIIYSFNGIVWSVLTNNLKGKIYSLGDFNGSLLACGYNSFGSGYVYLYDGVSWSVLTNINLSTNGKFVSFGSLNKSSYNNNGSPVGIPYVGGFGSIYSFDGTRWYSDVNTTLSSAVTTNNKNPILTSKIATFQPITISYSSYLSAYSCVYSGKLYVGANDGGGALGSGAVYTFDGNLWSISTVFSNSPYNYGNISSAVVYSNSLYVSGLPNGIVSKFDGSSWSLFTNLNNSSVNILGSMVVFNNKIYGSDSSGTVYSFDGNVWSTVTNSILGLRESFGINPLIVYNNNLYGGIT